MGAFMLENDTSKMFIIRSYTYMVKKRIIYIDKLIFFIPGSRLFIHEDPNEFQTPVRNTRALRKGSAKLKSTCIQGIPLVEAALIEESAKKFIHVTDDLVVTNLSPLS
jgi:hypothetical protein